MNRVSFQAIHTLIVAASVFMLVGCSASHDQRYSRSVKQSRRRGDFVAEYRVPDSTQLGRYRPVEVWVESVSRRDGDENTIVVRLRGPHADSEPRVHIVGRRIQEDYRGIWSERNGPPYEAWAAPEPLPETLVLSNDSVVVVLARETK